MSSMLRMIFTAVLMLTCSRTHADQVSQAPCAYWIEMQAQITSSPPLITVSWLSDPCAPDYTIYRKSIGSSSWGTPLATVAGNVNSYQDASVVAGIEYEYRIDKATTQDSRGFGGRGFLCTGIGLPLIDDRGAIILIVDLAHVTSLATELSMLQSAVPCDEMFYGLISRIS